MQIKLYNQKGKSVGAYELPARIFEVPANSDVIHRALVAQTSNQRHPVAHTKTRGEVRGGGIKPWRQKGTGRARHGSIRSPIWVGGGVTFGPQPRTFEALLTKKVKDLALRSALSAKAAAERVWVIVDPVFKEPKTAVAQQLLAKLKTRKALVVVPELNTNVFRSFRNLADATVDLVGNLNPYEVLNSGDLVFFQESIGKLKERLTEKRKTVKVVKAIKPVKVVKKTVGPKRKTKSKKR